MPMKGIGGEKATGYYLETLKVNILAFQVQVFLQSLDVENDEDGDDCDSDCTFFGRDQ